MEVKTYCSNMRGEITSWKAKISDLMQKMVTIAERGCIVANTLKDAVALSISID